MNAVEGVRMRHRVEGMTFGELLRRYRTRAELTQEALAEKAGLSRRGIADLERGARRSPYRHTMRQLANSLGLLEPEREAMFAAGRRVDASRTNRKGTRPLVRLPEPISNFVGREHAREEVTRHLGQARLVTLVGPGGIGKTRLALEAARATADDYADGVVFVDLAPLRDGGLLAEAVASELDLAESDRPLLEGVTENLESSRLLLVLDNCEHLIRPSAEFAHRLLQACRFLRILATSREQLGIGGEVTWRVPPLSVPDPSADLIPEQLADFDAIRLFVERARLVCPDFVISQDNAPAIAKVCRQVDGIPLALELAAARIRVLAPDQLAERLHDRFRLLVGGSRAAPTRQQTLRATIDWSYDLLSDAERLLFDRLTVFSGGWTLEAAETVCATNGIAVSELLDLLTHLVDKSLVSAEPASPGEVRYRQLETLRQYGADRLAERPGDMAPTRDRHARLMLALAERYRDRLDGADQRAWFSKLESEQDNFRAALAWSIECGDAETGLRLAAALAPFWLRRGYATEGRGWLRRQLGAAHAGPAGARASALFGDGQLAAYQHDFESARDTYEEALGLWRELANQRGVGICLREIGYVELSTGNIQRAELLLNESISQFRALADGAGLEVALSYLGGLAATRGDYARAHTMFDEMLALGRAQGHAFRVASALHSLGRLAWKRNELQLARTLLEQGLQLSKELGEVRNVAVCLESLAVLESAGRQFDRAARLFGAADALRAAMGAGRRQWLQADHERAVEATRTALGERAFAAAWSDGHHHSLDGAVAIALGGRETRLEAQSPRRSGHLDALTRRELEVAHRVAEGLTNRQIGEALVITEGTASLHVKRVLHKLGFRSRAQITSWILREVSPVDAPGVSSSEDIPCR